MRRRTFVSACALTLSLPPLTTLNRLHGIEAFKRPTPGKLNLSLAAYSMRKYLAPAADEARKMDLFEFVDFCFEQGLPGAELTSYYFPEQVTQDYLLKLRRHCHLRGITISGGAIRNDFCTQDAAALAKDVEHTKMWIDYYAILGAPAIRIFAGKENTSEPMSATLQRCAQTCQAVCEYAEKKGVILALENHGGVTAKAEDLLEIVHKVESPAFGINFDSGNFRSDADPYLELEKIAPYAVNAQVKVEMHVNGAAVEADLARILKILRDAGYSGWVALEYEAKGEPIDAIPQWLQKLKAIV